MKENIVRWASNYTKKKENKNRKDDIMNGNKRTLEKKGEMDQK